MSKGCLEAFSDGVILWRSAAARGVGLHPPLSRPHCLQRQRFRAGEGAWPAMPNASATAWRETLAKLEQRHHELVQMEDKFTKYPELMKLAARARPVRRLFYFHGLIFLFT